MAEPGPAARVAAALYGAGVRVFHGGYDRGWFRVRSLPVPVVSVGNLTVGGTGKTPAVLALARALRDAGRRPVVLTRGYRGRRASGVLRAGAWEDGATAGAREAGDEPLLLSRTLPSVPVVIGRNRGREAMRFLGSGERVDAFLLDDGFQHRVLDRNRDLVLLDARRPLANGRLLPAGPLREDPRALERADRLLLVTPGPDAAVGPETDRLLRALAPGAARSRVWPVFRGLALLAGGDPPSRGAAPSGIPDGPVLAVAGIARPERFRRLLEGAGARVAGTRWFRDHHLFSPAEVKDLETAAAALGAIPVTTAKDAVRLEGRVSAPWLVAEMALEVEGGWDRLVQSEFGERAP